MFTTGRVDHSPTAFARFFPAPRSATDGVLFVVGNLAPWLTGVLADAGHKKLTE